MCEVSQCYSWTGKCVLARELECAYGVMAQQFGLLTQRFFFFFQAEDGIRDYKVTGVQTCALPIFLVMGTLHTNGAAPTVDRMVNAFPSDKQSHVRTMLSTSLRGVVSQQLLQRADRQGRVAALEILVNTPAASNLIRQGKLDQLENTMQAGGQFGMRTMDTAIQQLLDQRQISGKEAYKKAINKTKFEDLKDSG